MSDEIEPGLQSAFPWSKATELGLTKRELFAAMIAQGLAANAEVLQAHISQEAVWLADELNAELEKPRQESK